ncbi:C4-dicarboxylate ABC transporter substrate-binding protein [Deltaproteobacteria bacterium]|nr:C4-dicarboxylate ABC transporter substrate-binding protein [Deltaproteobacteria bacterium]
MKKRIVMLLAAALLSALMISTANAKTVFRVSHTLDPTSHYNKGLMYLHDLLQKKTNGELGLDIYHSAQIGSERDAIEGVTMGTLEMTLTSSAPLSNFTKTFLVFDLPFIITDRAKAYKWMDGPEGQAILDSLKKQNMVGLSIWENGFRHLSNSKLPVVQPEDAKGLKIRLMENAVHIATFKALDAYPTPIPFGELFTAMQQKTVDGQENPLVIISTSKFNEVQKYLSLTGHFYAPAILLINKDVWEKKLSADQRKIMTECIAEARDWERKYSLEMDGKLAGELEKAGMVVSSPDKAVWAKKLSPVYAQFETVIGKDVIQSLINSQK